MSRDFDLQSGPPEEDFNYQKGDPLPADISEKLIEDFEAKYHVAFSGLWKEVLTHAGRIAEPSTQGLVDTIIAEFRRRGPGNHPDHLINKVVRLLYEQGFESFEMDYRDFEQSRDHALWIGGEQYAHAERPLVLSYIFDVRDRPGETVGTKVHHCRISTRGSIFTSGSASADSQFYHEVPPHNVGINAKRSSFHLDGLDSDAYVEKINDKYFGCYYGDPHEEKRVILPYNFFEEGNALLVPDGEGGWQEVREK